MVPQIITLLMLVAALIAVIVLKGRCGDAVGSYFHSLDEPTGQEAGRP